jgi:hypothetical protein
MIDESKVVPVSIECLFPTEICDMIWVFGIDPTSTLVINALRSGAWAWIEGNPTPDVEILNLPDSLLGQLVHKAYVEQTSLGWNLLFRGFWTISWRTAQEYEFSNNISY